METTKTTKTNINSIIAAAFLYLDLLDPLTICLLADKYVKATHNYLSDPPYENVRWGIKLNGIELNRDLDEMRDYLQQRAGDDVLSIFESLNIHDVLKEKETLSRTYKEHVKRLLGIAFISDNDGDKKEFRDYGFKTFTDRSFSEVVDDSLNFSNYPMVILDDDYVNNKAFYSSFDNIIERMIEPPVFIHFSPKRGVLEKNYHTVYVVDKYHHGEYSIFHTSFSKILDVILDYSIINHSLEKELIKRLKAEAEAYLDSTDPLGFASTKPRDVIVRKVNGVLIIRTRTINAQHELPNCSITVPLDEENTIIVEASQGQETIISLDENSPYYYNRLSAEEIHGACSILEYMINANIKYETIYDIRSAHQENDIRKELTKKD